MPTTLAIRRRRALAKRGIGMPGNNDVILGIARKLSRTVDAPVLGGIAVYLHGYPRATTDLDFYTPDRRVTDEQLRAGGAKWDAAKREHVLDDVRIHTVTPEDAGHVVAATSIIEGVRVVSLKDLIAIKLRCGLGNLNGSKDVGDVVELIRVVPLDKRFAARLPRDLRSDYKRIVDAVRAGERDRRDKPRF
jgi:predicted nucleotidyltransferase component of viral defense system